MNAFADLSILIADDHVIIRRGLKFLLETHFGKISIVETDSSKGNYRDWETDRKSTRLNSSHSAKSRMPSSA